MSHCFHKYTDGERCCQCGQLRGEETEICTPVQHYYLGDLEPESSMERDRR